MPSPVPPVAQSPIEQSPIEQSPVEQSIRIGFRAISVATLALAAWWLTLNCRPVPPDTQAVVQRFGAVARVQPAGLVLALPRPIETVRLLPGPDRQLTLKIAAGDRRGHGLDDPYAGAAGQTMPADAAPFLVGDGSVVVLDATLVWRIRDAAAYVVAADHVPAALRRLYLASALALAARRDLDQFLIARPERGGASAAAQARRQALRGDLAREINARLTALADAGAPLGVEVTRVDADALLPPAAKLAFDSVLDAAQMADQGLAAARTDAERIGQAAARESDRLLDEARAAAAERIAHAREVTAGIAAVASGLTPDSRTAVLDQLYRQRLADVLRAAGSVTAVDGTASRVILPGPGP
jgi:regulator of protease activity HflC (stomatin/prohibitin superfamily)